MSHAAGHTDPVTISVWTLQQAASNNLSLLFSALSVACKYTDSAVRKAGLIGVMGLAGTGNESGEAQKKLDVLANKVFINCLTRSKQVAIIVSEEEAEPIVVPEDKRGRYVVAMDPLDGSSNIDCGVSIGTIYGIWELREGEEITSQSALRSGRELVAAGYCLYGSSCNMVASLGGPPAHFIMDPSLGDFVQFNADLHVPERGNIYSINEGNAINWHGSVSRYVQDCKYPSKGKPKSLRYVGSMVADVHRTILYGGVFLYPGDQKNPNGKLRVLYECFPMAFLVEKGGGLATTGTQPILDVVPTELHQRSPIFLGSSYDVKKILATIEKFGDEGPGHGCAGTDGEGSVRPVPKQNARYVRNESFVV